ncbi:MAG TPA: Ig-like domain-containing protein, partial [Silvibacterium sp.]|nr:Ig-like domain-containing protein [Silvibacterium sp.]
GTATITALYSNSTGGTAATGTATFTVTGGTTEQFTAVSITPGSLALSASGQTSQLIALGTSGSTGLMENVTDSTQIQWSSSISSIASVSASGLVTGLSAGNSTITAVLTNADGSVVSNTATVAVSLTAAPEPLLSLTIIPSSITVGNLQDTGNFLAIGTFSSPPYVRDLTDSVTWFSSAPDVFPVNSNNSAVEPVGAAAGVVTAYGNGSAVIIAEATGSDGTIQTATATFACPLVLPTPTTAGSCYPGSQAPALKATITIYNEGLNTTNWEITAPSATGTPDVIHCGPGWALGGGTGGSVCAAAYPIGTTVTLTAPSAGAAFGGWSSTCTQTTPVTAAGPNSCTVTISPSNPNVTVGAIFN